MRVTFWGTRGSIATPGRSTLHYGGNTSCVEVRTDDGTLIILDSGTGIRELGEKLLREEREIHGHVFLSHTHWDHIQGWPFFTPAFLPHNEFTIHALAGIQDSLEAVLANQMEHQYFPIRFDALAAKVNVQEIREGKTLLDRVKVSVHYLNHTCVCLGYRIEAAGKAVIYTTDTEPHGLVLLSGDAKEPEADRQPHLAHERDRELAAFVEGADLLIMDAQYTDAEYPGKIGWGHSTTGFTTDIGVLGGVKRLALFHHDPLHGDEALDRMVAQARGQAARYGSDIQIIGASEGDTIEL